jgi:transposase-like protein
LLADGFQDDELVFPQGREHCLVLKYLYKNQPLKNSKVMFKREKKYYSEEFKERALTAYYHSNDSVSKIALRFGVSRDTFSSWVYRRSRSSASRKNDNLASLNPALMQKESLSPENQTERIIELEHQLSLEKMRSESLSKMIEIAGRELKIDIRKKSGAKQSLR